MILGSVLGRCGLLQEAYKCFDARICAHVIIGGPELFKLDAAPERLGAATPMHAKQALLAP